ncbi:MAG: aminoacyl-tRNA hydrolase [Planctomycetota bacterium]
MKLVVGLGNPGRKYAATRHNVGFGVAEVLAGRHGAGKPRAKFQGETVEINVNGRRGLVLCPHTYMNRSGLSVLKARDFFKMDAADIMIICDDFNLPLGKLRCRAKGSAGGQKGLQDIFRCLGTDRIPRLRIGIGTPPEGWDVSGYVLSKFAADELPLIRKAIDRAADAVAVWAQDGIEICMNRYNVDPTLSE